MFQNSCCRVLLAIVIYITWTRMKYNLCCVDGRYL